MNVISDEGIDASSVIIAGVAEREGSRWAVRSTAEIERLSVVGVQVSNAKFVREHWGTAEEGLPVRAVDGEVRIDSRALTGSALF